MDAKLYGTFAPPERLTLLLEAMARQDDAEVERLRDTCPRATYTHPDAQFEERVRLGMEILVVVCIDLRAMWAKLFMIEWSKQLVRHFAPVHHLTATLGFIDGARCTQGLAASPFFTAPESDDMEDEQDDEPNLVRAEAFADRMLAVEGRAERATADVLDVFDGAAKGIAQQLADTWAAFDGFCRSRLGAEAMTVFRAWQMPLGDEVEAMLRLHRDVKPDPENVKECRRLLDLTWDRRLGEEGHSDGD